MRRALLLISVLAGCGAGQHPDDPLVVGTTAGLVRGQLEGDAMVWRGIPFAAPPTGPLRWKPPAPALPWDGVRDALEYGPLCMQTPSSAEPEGPAIGSEDCLTLDVFAPATASARPRPVIVFIHGGFFTWHGSSQLEEGVRLYDGKKLAVAADALFVPINYRLGPFGFLGHPALSAESEHRASGNYGLLDQLAALRWVQDNIAAFGGDPTRVTVMGQSAGAISIGALYASPLSRGLFRGAIMHSGTAEVASRERAEQAGVDLASALGCADLACLRGKSAAEVIAAGPERFGTGYGYGPSVDGWVVPEQPTWWIEHTTQPLPALLTGITAEEFSTMIGHFVHPFPEDAAGYEAYLRGAFSSQAADWVLEHYPLSDYPSPIVALIAFYGDLGMICPSRRLARVAAAHAPVYRFVWDHTYESGDYQVFAAGHGLDLPFVLGNFVGLVPSPAEEELSAQMVARWASFVATGDPGHGWSRYVPERDNLLVLDDVISQHDGYRSPQCDAWDAITP